MLNRSLVKLLIVVFLFSINGFSQSNSSSNKNVDSLLVLVKQNTKKETINIAQCLLDEARELKISRSDLDRIKLNYYQASIHIVNEKDEEALQLLLKGYTGLELINATSYHSKHADDIGRIFSRARNYDSAIKYFRQSIGYAKEQNDSLVISNSYLNIGSVFQVQNKLDSTGYYYKKVMQFHPTNTIDSEILATTYSNLIGVALGESDFELAEHYGKKSLNLQKQRKDTLKIAGVLSNLGSINMYTRDLEKSNEYYFQAYDLLKERKDIKAREITVITLDNISQVYYLQGDYKTGYDYLFESATIEKELIVENSINKIAEIAAKYALNEKEKQSKIEKEKRKNAELWLYIFGFSTFGLLFLFWLFIRTNRLKKEKIDLEFQREKIEQANEIEKMQNEIQIKILNATLDAKEEERRYISEILHGNVSTLLSSANMHLYKVKTELKENTPKEVEKIESIIIEASEKVRNLSHKLISSVLLKFGIKTSIEDLCEKYTNSMLKFKFKSKNIGRYNESFEIKIHNIVEELANNIMKHSNAYNATVRIEQVKKRLHIRINDDGDGFDIKDAIKKDGLGLSQISARIKVMKGKFDLKSYENTGTQIFIDIPIPE